jgi:nucleotide-binding universal stress UspA family protein
MSDQREELAIERILVGLDTSYDSLAALRAAVELAHGLGARLHGMFVEDVNLLRVAELSVARELPYPFATRSRLSPRRMRRQLRAQAEQARQALSSLCQKRQVEWSFHVAQGSVSAEVLEEAGRADLLCVGRASRPVLGRSDVGSTATAAATEAPRSVLLVPRGTRIHPPIVVLYEDAPDARRALVLASQLAQHIEGLLSVVVPAAVTGPSREIQKQITDQLDAEGLVIRYRELIGSGVMSLIGAIQTEGGGVLVLGRSFLPPGDVEKLLNEVQRPVLLVR